MRIDTIYIENFGHFSNKLWKLDNFNEFFESNGYGKSTLAAFLKSMFYGLPKNSKTIFSDREHYYPFNSGKYGGYLIFTYQTKQYRIERYFDKTSNTRDTLKVYENGKETSIFGELIGKTIFGLDEDSFIRTLFINSEDIEIKSTSGINEKLNNYVNNTSKDNNYDSTISLLDKQQKKLKNSKGAGTIPEINEEIKKKKSLLSDLIKIKENISKLYSEYKEKERTNNNLKKEIIDAQNQNSMLEKWNIYEDNLKDIKTDEEEYKKLCSMYQYGFITKEEANKIKDNLLNINTQKEIMIQNKMTESELLEYKRLSILFSNGTPTSTILDDYQRKIDSLKILESKINNDTSINDNDQLILDKFKGREPSVKDIEKLSFDIENLKETKKQIEARSSLTVNVNEDKKSLLPIILLIVSLIFLATGIALLFINILIGTLLSVFGVATLLFSGFIYFKNKLNTNAVKTDEKLLDLLQEEKALSIGINIILSRFGYQSDNGILSDYNLFTIAYDKYTQLVKDNKQKEQNNNNLVKQIKEIKSVLDNSLKNSLFIDYQASLDLLRKNILEYEQYTKQEKSFLEKQEKATQSIKESEEIINEIITKYHLSMNSSLSDTLEKFSKDEQTIKKLKEQIEKKTQKANEFKKEKNLTEMISIQSIDVDSLRNNYDKNNIELKRLSEDISNSEIEISKIDDVEEDIKNKNEQLLKYKEKYNDIASIINYLNISESNLKNKYLNPIRDKFTFYSDMIIKTLKNENIETKEIISKLNMDEDCNITFEANGEQHDDKYLSSGIKAIINFCLRLALIDNMYNDNDDSPFIIMDDPFLTLDANYMNGMKELINQISNTRQIIYFCCHKSRSIKE